MKVHYPKLYNMAHLLALNVLLFPKDLTIIIICYLLYSLMLIRPQSNIELQTLLSSSEITPGE